MENVQFEDPLTYITKDINSEDKIKDKDFDYLIVLALYFNGQYEK